MQTTRAHRLVSFVLALFSTILIATMVLSCGGGSSSTPPPTPPPPPGTSAAQLRIGDAPVDKVVAFEVTIGSPLTATPAGSGSPVQVQVGPNRLELSHMAAKLEPLGISNIPQGTYSGATVTILNPEVKFFNSSGTLVTIQGAASQTVNITFSPALTIGSGTPILNIDLNIANSLAVDASGNITGFNFSNSSFSITTGTIAAENQQEDDSGEMEDIMGQVTAVSSSTFTLNAGQSGAQLVFTTDNTTQFTDGLTNIASLLNQIVRVDGVTRADGSMFAKKVEGIESVTGSELDGLITLVTGNPATALTVLAHDGTGSGMDNNKVGATFNVNVAGLAASKYRINQSKCDFSGMTVPGPNFPFDPTTIHAGQRIEVESISAVPAANGSITADKIKLEQQAVGGTVSNFVAGTGGAATFDLTLPAGSHLTVLSGQTVVHVFQQPGTNNKFGTISNTKVLRVRGLLFWTGTTFNMIARRITQ